MEFPIDLKYYKISLGESLPLPSSNGLTVPAYIVTNKETGVREAEDVSFPDLYEHALGLDRNMHRAINYLEKNLNYKHLEGCIQEEGQEVPAILLPAYEGPETGEGGVH